MDDIDINNVADQIAQANDERIHLALAEYMPTPKA